jgi:hypothetical protein
MHAIDPAIVKTTFKRVLVDRDDLVVLPDEAPFVAEILARLPSDPRAIHLVRAVKGWRFVSAGERNLAYWTKEAGWVKAGDGVRFAEVPSAQGAFSPLEAFCTRAPGEAFDRVYARGYDKPLLFDATGAGGSPAFRRVLIQEATAIAAAEKQPDLRALLRVQYRGQDDSPRYLVLDGLGARSAVRAWTETRGTFLTLAGVKPESFEARVKSIPGIIFHRKTDLALSEAKSAKSWVFASGGFALDLETTSGSKLLAWCQVPEGPPLDKPALNKRVQAEQSMKRVLQRKDVPSEIAGRCKARPGEDLDARASRCLRTITEAVLTGAPDAYRLSTPQWVIAICRE